MKLRRITAAILLLCLICSLGACQTAAPEDYGFLNTLPRATFFVPAPEPEPEPEPEPDPLPDFFAKIGEAHAINKDVVGWLYLPGVNVDHPIVQARNNTYYARKTLDLSYNYAGILYADYECKMGNSDKLSQNTIIYGHNLDDDRENGEMFAQMINFDILEFAQEHRFVTYASHEEVMTWVIFAAFYTDTRLQYIYASYSKTRFTNLINEAVKRSEIITDVEVTTDDKIFTMSTCTYKYGKRKDQRFVVMARLLRDGETMADFGPIEKNPSPKAPQF